MTIDKGRNRPCQAWARLIFAYSYNTRQLKRCQGTCHSSKNKNNHILHLSLSPSLSLSTSLFLSPPSLSLSLSLWLVKRVHPCKHKNSAHPHFLLARALSIPHSVSQLVSMRDYYTNNSLERDKIFVKSHYCSISFCSAKKLRSCKKWMKWLRMKGKISSMAVNEGYESFSFAVHEQSVTRFSKTITSC